MRLLGILLLATLGTSACGPRAGTRAVAARTPDDWVAIQPPDADTPAAWCVNWAADAWAVTIDADSSALDFRQARGERMNDSLVVDDGLLTGDDAGEFGGAVWWQDRDGRRDTLRIAGRDTAGFYADNLHALLRAGGEVYALVGLAHLGMNSGELVRLRREPDGH